MNRKKGCEILKRIIFLILILFILSHGKNQEKMYVQATELETEMPTVSAWKVENQGLFIGENAEPFGKATDCENEIPWVNGTHGTLFWKVSVDNQFAEICSIEVYREEERISSLDPNPENLYIVEISEQQYAGVYRMVITDFAGNQCEVKQYIKVDKIPPNAEEILISFFAENQGESISLPENRIENFLNYIQHLFVKNYVKATIYVPDPQSDGACSGVEEMTFSYHNQSYTKKCEPGNYVYREETPDLVYSMFEVILPEAPDGMTANVNSSIVITGLKDFAGNVFSDEVSDLKIKNDAMIVIDDLNPVLSMVDYKNSKSVMKKKGKVYYFYGIDDAAEVLFEIEETHFDLKAEDGTASLPVFEIYPKPEKEINPEWIFSKEKAVTSLKFAGSKGQELLYHFSLNYKDPSGNPMIGKEVYQKNFDGRGSYLGEYIVIDDLAPVLKRFDIISNGGQLLWRDGIYYAENLQNKEDIQIAVTIQDSPIYFCEENIVVEYSDDAIHWNALQLEEGQHWTTDLEEHSAVYCFDGKQSEETLYQFRVTYKDRANNQMVLSEEVSAAVRQGENDAYVSIKKVMLDHRAPEMTELFFGKPVQMFTGEHTESAGTVTTAINGSATRMYYDKDVKVSFCIKDKGLESKDVEIVLYRRPNKFSEWEAVEQPGKIERESADEKEKIGFFLPQEEAEYYYTVSCKDFSGNSMAYLGNEGELKDEMYQSPVFIIDATNPEFKVTYNKTPEQYNRVHAIKMVLEAKEKNLDPANTIIEIYATDINGNTIQEAQPEAFQYDENRGCFVAAWEALLNQMTSFPKDSASPDIQTLNLELSENANYLVNVKLQDKVRKTTTYHNAYCIDTAAPVISVVTKEGRTFSDEVVVKCGLLDFEKSDITYSVTNQGMFAKIMNKVTFGYFAKAKIIVHVKVHDRISGTASLIPACITEDGIIENCKVVCQRALENDTGVTLYDIELPDNFKGTIQMHGVDHAGNRGKDTGAIGMISESEKQHVMLAKTNMKVLSDYSKTPDYYNKDVKIKVTAKEGYSGFDTINYQAGDCREEIIYSEEEEICLSMTKEITLSSESNNKNHVELFVGFRDNAGHVSEAAKEELPIIHIDASAPMIDIQYDNQECENDRYYHEKRVATVTVTERNFDPADTLYEITGPSAQISDWSHIRGNGCEGSKNPEDTGHTDFCRWQSKVEFWQDGIYTFSFSTVDRAGNKSMYENTNEFVIDQTKPELKVSYDNYDEKNEFYYRKPRTATIEVTEVNFRASDVVFSMTASHGGKQIPAPFVEEWKKEGEVYRTKICFADDGEYLLDVEVKDLAGNVSADYEEDHFIVDITAPEIKVFNIENESANHGAVSPKVKCVDVNYDMEGTAWEVIGVKNGKVDLTASMKTTENGQEIQLEDFEHIPKMDDIYTMVVKSCDLAGNFSEHTILFSVNRFGSKYHFDEKTEKLVGEKGKYYTDKEQELVVYETNADRLENFEVTWNLNGKIRRLSEGKDFSVTESGGAKSWKQYTYRIFKENFKEEGNYILTIYSEDRAKNISDNRTKGKNIEFVVDKTRPEIIITGVEDYGKYREQEREVTIDVEDNVGISGIDIFLNEETVFYTGTHLAETDGKIKLTVENSNQWQVLKVSAYDVAGNREETKEYRFLITPNLFVQYYRNIPLLFGSCALVLVIGIVLSKKWLKEEL